MDEWQIEYWHYSEERVSSIEKFLDQLTNEQFKSLAKELQLLKLCGNNLRLPHSKSLGKGLFELRERNFGYRVYYSFVRNKSIVLLHIGGKSTQKSDIKIAKERLVKNLKQVKI